VGRSRLPVAVALAVALLSGAVPWRVCVPHDGGAPALMTPALHAHGDHEHPGCARVEHKAAGCCHHRHEVEALPAGHDGDGEAPDAACCSDVPLEVGAPFLAVVMLAPALAGLSPDAALADAPPAPPGSALAGVPRGGVPLDKDRTVLLR
jgi:hypothetical protein